MCVLYCDFPLGWETCGCICLKRGARTAALCKWLLQQMVCWSLPACLSTDCLKMLVTTFNMHGYGCMDACINYMSTVSKMAMGSQAYSAHWWWGVTPFVLSNPRLGEIPGLNMCTSVIIVLQKLYWWKLCGCFYTDIISLFLNRIAVLEWTTFTLKYAVGGRGAQGRWQMNLKFGCICSLKSVNHRDWVGYFICFSIFTSFMIR